MNIIGIDVGGSTTKIIGLDNNKITACHLVRASDPVTSVYGAFGKLITNGNISLSQIEKVVITGVGAGFITSPIFNIPTVKISEFIAIGLGGQYVSGVDRAIIVSMGTGTAIIEAENNKIKHIGGTGVGGGTLIGLSKAMLGVSNINNIIELAESGSLSNIDLTVGDIVKNSLSNLSSNTTASNFGKISDVASKNDIAAGLLNLVFETIGVTASFASKINGINDIVLTGNLTTIPQTEKTFKGLSELLGVNFIVPPLAEYATAIGAALSHTKGYGEA